MPSDFAASLLHEGRLGEAGDHLQLTAVLGGSVRRTDAGSSGLPLRVRLRGEVTRLGLTLNQAGSVDLADSWTGEPRLEYW